MALKKNFSRSQLKKEIARVNKIKSVKRRVRAQGVILRKIRKR